MLEISPFISFGISFIFGICIGSFLNVVIYRLPLMIQNEWRDNCDELLKFNSKENNKPHSSKLAVKFNLAYPASFCPKCNLKLKPLHNIPIFSYLFLRGKCAACNAHISLQYPLIELMTGILSALIVLKFGINYQIIFILLFVWMLITVSIIDLKTQLLPDKITLPLIWLGLIANYLHILISLEDALLGAILGYLILWIIFWVFKLITGKEGLGYGDFKLLAAFGAWFGWQSIFFILILSSLIGIITFMFLRLSKNHRFLKNNYISFGPSLALAALIYLFYGPVIIKWYLIWII